MPRSKSSVRRSRAIADAYRAGRPLVLVFDYDGTLTPIVRHPSLAVLSPATRAVLGALSRLPDVSVAVVSGRALDDVRERVAVPDAFYAGCGGMELDLLGTRVTDPEAARLGDTFDRVHDRLREPVRRFPGTWVERKPASLAVHYRALPPLAGVCFGFETTDILAQFPELRSRVVSAAIEVTPAAGWDKGTAVDAVLGRVRAAGRGVPFPVYFGDAPNDEEGMTAALAAGGIAIGVGPDAPPIGGDGLPDPNGVVTFLTDLHSRLAGDRGLPHPLTAGSESSDPCPEPEPGNR